MPFADINGFRMHFETDGVQDAPALLLSNSLGTTLDLWLPQIDALRQSHYVIRYDSRGQGQSETPAGPYTIEVMARDALALLDFLKIPKADFCGVSMGGMVGMWIAIHHPSRLNKLVLANTAPVLGSSETWNSRIEAVQNGGMEPVASQ